MKRLVLLIAILLGFVAQDSYANVLVNPGFESGTGTDADNWTELGSMIKRLYHLNDLSGTNVNDSASDGIDGTIYGNPVWKDGSPAGECPDTQNGCLDLDGTGDYVDIGSALGKPTNYTIEAWIKPVAWTNASIASGNSGAADATLWGFVFRDTGDDVEVWTSNGTSGQLANVDNWNSTNYPSGSWTHIAATVDGTNIKFYRNGTLITTISQTVAMGGTAYSFSIGRLGEYAGFYFNGDIDEVAIYDNDITQAQIRTDCGWNGSTCAGHELTGTETSPPDIGRVSGANCRTGTYCMESTLGRYVTSDLYSPSNNYSTGTFSVYAKADASRTTDIILLDQDNTVLCTINATLTTSYAQYSKTCGFNGWVKKVKLRLDMVTTTGTIWLDDTDLSFQETYVSPSSVATIGSGIMDVPKNTYLFHVGNAYWAFFADGSNYKYAISGNGGETWGTPVTIDSAASSSDSFEQFSVWYANIAGHDRFYTASYLDTNVIKVRMYGLDNSSDTTLTLKDFNDLTVMGPYAYVNLIVDDGNYLWRAHRKYVSGTYRFIVTKSISRLENIDAGWNTEIALSSDIASTNLFGSCLPLNTLYSRGWGDGTAARVLCQWNENGTIKYRYSVDGSSFASEVTVATSVVADIQSAGAMVDSKYNVWFNYRKTDGTLAVKKLSYPYTVSDLSSEIQIASATVDGSYLSAAVGDDDIYVAYEKGGALYYRKHIETDAITTWQTETTLVASGVDSGPLGMAMNVDRFGYLYRSGTDLKFIKLDLNSIGQRGTRVSFKNITTGPLHPRSTTYCNNILTFGALTTDYEVQLVQYNLTTETYSDIYTLKKMARDDHGYPEIVADSSCYLYVMVGGRLEDAEFYKSNSPNDITTWTLKNSFPNRIYHQMQMDQADIIHWTARLNSGAPTYIYYRKYTVSTSTWSSETTLVQPALGYETAYPTRFCMGKETTGQKSLHIVWVDYDSETNRGKGLYYIQSTNGGSTWKKADGTTITLPADNTDADIIYSQASGELYAFAGCDPGNTGTPRIATAVLDTGDTFYELRYFYWNGSSWVARPITDQTEIGDVADYGVRMLRDDSQGITYIYGGRHPVGSQTAEAWQWVSTDDFQTFNATKIIGNYDDNFWYPTEFLAGPMLITTWNRRVSLIHGETEWFVTLRPGVKDKLLNYKLNSSINPNIN